MKFRRGPAAVSEMLTPRGANLVVRAARVGAHSLHCNSILLALWEGGALTCDSYREPEDLLALVVSGNVLLLGAVRQSSSWIGTAV